ncbi:MAG: glycosyltransferase [Oscillospiraceae bacterium]|nr:glycosyltransferase [Oscillospiraceae bacterium]
MFPVSETRRKKHSLSAGEAEKPVSLSVCLIVRDEERVLGRSLSAAVQFADELIVVDTGSRDRSREIAGEYTDLVFSEPWQNSFARARNFAASKAGCDFVMWLDADDVMRPEEIEKLLALKKRLTLRTDVVFMTYRNYGFLSDMGLRDRIHRREFACRWEGDVHEAIPLDGSMNMMFCPEITILHKKEYVNEPNRNMRIFDGVRNAGRLSGAYLLSYYVRELSVRDETERALEAWEELLLSKPSASRVQYALVFLTGMLIRQKEYEKCWMLIDTSVEQYGVPLSAYLCYHLGLAAEGLGDVGEARRQYRLATGIPVDVMTGMIEVAGYDDYLPCLKLCALAYDRGETEESEAWNSRAGRAWPEGRAWRINRERFFARPLPAGREPLVSVIMPAYNAEAYVSEAVSSILNQSWQNFELIIVDNASTDATCDVIRRFSDPRIRFLKNDRNIGVAGSTNRAVGVSRGEYLALMDADDVSLPDRLKAQVTALEDNPEIMVLGTSSSVIDREGNVVGCTAALPDSPKYYQARLLLGNLEFCNSTAMIRKSFLEEHRLSFREGYPGLQDYRFYMEASKLGAVSCLADSHHRYRVHGDGITARTRREMPAERAELYNSIRCDSLRMSGVRLTEQEESLLGRLLPENALPVWNRQEREQLTALFAGIRNQLAAEAFPALRELDDILWGILNH